MKRTVLLLLLAIAASPAIAESERQIDQQLPPLVIYVYTNADAGTEGFGLVMDAIGAIIEKRAQSSLDYLKTLNSQAGLESVIGAQLACVGVTDVSKGCRRSMSMSSEPFTPRAIGANATADLQKIVAAEPSQSALVLEATQHFDGKVYHLMTRLLPVRIANDQSVVVDGDRAAAVRFMHTYSLHADNRQRAAAPETSAALPRVGSKDARMHYWTEGEPPRLLHVMQQSIKTMAQAYENALGSNPDPVFADPSRAYKKTLPKLSSLIPDAEQCRNSFRRVRFVRDLHDEDYIWVTDVYDGRWIIIIPRCDFEV